jgi:hypothetical protein
MFIFMVSIFQAFEKKKKKKKKTNKQTNSSLNMLIILLPNWVEQQAGITKSNQSTLSWGSDCLYYLKVMKTNIMVKKKLYKIMKKYIQKERT